MNTYKRIITFIIPFWKHIIVAVIFSFLYSILHGASVYLSIPLLDTLFQQSGEPSPNGNAELVSNDKSSMVPDWLSNFIKDLSDSFNEFIFSGDTSDILLRIVIFLCHHLL